MEDPLLRERWSRQILLPEVRADGQRRLGESSLAVAGSGAAARAAADALARVGIGSLLLPAGFPPLPVPPPRGVGLLPGPEEEAAGVVHLVLEDGAALRRAWNRRLRASGRSALFGFAAGSGAALLWISGAGCPCLECLEAWNPKAVTAPWGPGAEFLAAAAAGEVVRALLDSEASLSGELLVLTLRGGGSFRRCVEPTWKCAAALLAAGARFTP